MPPLGRSVTRLRGSGACTPSHSKRARRTSVARIAVAPDGTFLSAWYAGNGGDYEVLTAHGGFK